MPTPLTRALLSLALCGCTATVDATQVTVVVDADGEVRERAVAVEVAIFDEAGAPLETASLDAAFPHELIAYRIEEPVFYMVITAEDVSGALVARELVAVRFADGRSKQLELELMPRPAICDECTFEEHCDTAGGCEIGRVVDASELPDRPLPSGA